MKNLLFQLGILFSKNLSSPFAIQFGKIFKTFFFFIVTRKIKQKKINMKNQSMPTVSRKNDRFSKSLYKNETRVK